ncbi:MAG TPA: hypothetical protein DCO79_00355, partial [Spirochaeta sp.]|nr:hypothetical protein [Spirochaeta sp.]
DEYEAVIKCRSGALLDVIVRKSRIFLSEDNGAVISFQPILAKRITATPLFSNAVSTLEPSVIFTQLDESITSSNTVRVLNQLPTAVRSLVLGGSPSDEIRVFITDIYNSGLKKLAAFAEKELGTPPCEYTVLSLGSSGRSEMTLFSDQDNALVFRAGEDEPDSLRLYFLTLADRICGLLNQAGFPYCPGGIMAINPLYCLSLEEWKNRYRKWFAQADNISLLDIHVFFDLKAAWGSDELVDELYMSIFSDTVKRSEFFTHFARNCLEYKAPKGILGNLRTEIRNGMDVINLKETMTPLINYARISALKEGISVSSTLERLKKLHKHGNIDDLSYAEMCSTFEVLWRLRFSNQIFAHGELRKINDDLAPSTLSDENYKELKDAVSVISATQSRLSYEFLGVDIS